MTMQVAVFGLPNLATSLLHSGKRHAICKAVKGTLRWRVAKSAASIAGCRTQPIARYYRPSCGDNRPYADISHASRFIGIRTLMWLKASVNVDTWAARHTG